MTFLDRFPGRFADLKLPFILLLEIALCLAFGDMVPEFVKTISYSFSMLLKNILVLLLPLIIFSILFANLGNLSKGAFAFTVLAFSCVILSNFSSTCVAGLLGSTLLDTLFLKENQSASGQDLMLVWENMGNQNWMVLVEKIQLISGYVKSIFTNDRGLFAGIFSGLILAMISYPPAQKLATRLQSLSFKFFQKFFIPLIPLFVLGFIFNMEHSGVLDSVVDNYLGVVIAIGLFAYAYIFILYGLSTGFNPRDWFQKIQRIFPAALTGFSTMSSASAMPLLIEGVRQNTQKNDAQKTSQSVTGIVPISVNIHLVGDCFTIPILALAIMVSFGLGLPSLDQFLMFTVFFVLAKFAVAAVPGGGILVMIPILEKYLGFTPDMISLITALYILFDPIITSANVFGNGAFAQLFSKAFSKIGSTTMAIGKGQNA